MCISGCRFRRLQSVTLWHSKNQRFFPTIKSSFIHCRFLYHKRSKKDSRNPAHKMSLSAAMSCSAFPNRWFKIPSLLYNSSISSSFAEPFRILEIFGSRMRNGYSATFFVVWSLETINDLCILKEDSKITI